jgi:hypothetical protein
MISPARQPPGEPPSESTQDPEGTPPDKQVYGPAPPHQAQGLRSAPKVAVDSDGFSGIPPRHPSLTLCIVFVDRNQIDSRVCCPNTAMDEEAQRSHLMLRATVLGGFERFSDVGSLQLL